LWVIELKCGYLVLKWWIKSFYAVIYSTSRIIAVTKKNYPYDKDIHKIKYINSVWCTKGTCVLKAIFEIVWVKINLNKGCMTPRQLLHLWQLLPTIYHNPNKASASTVFLVSRQQSNIENQISAEVHSGFSTVLASTNAT